MRPHESSDRFAERRRPSESSPIKNVCRARAFHNYRPGISSDIDPLLTRFQMPDSCTIIPALLVGA
jgi:hypothetical protein